MLKKTSSNPLSEEYIRWAIRAYDDGYLRWSDMDGATYDVVDQELRRRYRKRRAREDEARRKKKVEPPWQEIRKLAEDSMQQVWEMRKAVNTFGSTLSKPKTAPPPSSKTTSSTAMGEILEIKEGKSKDVSIETAKVMPELKKDEEII